MHRARSAFVAAILFAAILFAAALAAAPNGEAAGDTTAAVYRQPDPAVTAMVDAPLTPGVIPSPNRRWLALAAMPSLPGIETLAARELRLAGLRIDPATTGPSRSWPLTGLTLLRVADGSERPVAGLPPSPQIGNIRWSPDSSHLAFTHTTAEGIELWVVDAASARARRLANAPLSLVAGDPPAWLPDSRALVAALVPSGRAAEPAPPRVPAGPVIQENRGSRSPARTYQDLLSNDHDAALFEHYLTAQLARIGLDGSVSRLGEPALLWDFSPSPDGRYLLVETLHRPFSYLVPAFRFPRRVEVWSVDGRRVAELADLPLQEGVPIAFGSVPTGPREHEWRADAPATLLWAEALDGGDAGAEADQRDRLLTLAAPFTAAPKTFATLALRYGGTTWGDDDLALVTEWWWPTRTRRVWRLRPDRPGAAPELLVERSWEDRYSDPGSPLMVPNAAGREVLLTVGDGETLLLAGAGASPQGDRPFLDAFDLRTQQTRRLFHSEAPFYERPLEVLDAESLTVLTRRESVEEPPNYFVRRLGSGADSGAGRPPAAPRRLTDFPHPTPQLQGLGKEMIRYQRDDGVELTATLYTPPGWTTEQGPLPVVVWAYPQEFKSADHAGQVTDSPYRFDRLWWGSPLLWLTQGYAVLDDPSMPIVGEGEEEPNDTYVEQLVASAEAAVTEVVRRGVGAPGRFAVGGHSYGAFMAANLLAHSDLFAAGIARSGAYNRTLTPFGFQSEERSLWQAPDVYFATSPFLHADKIDEPLLLIHGEADNNSGTFPMQSERFYSALKGHGATARLVMLPHESHGYRARESVLHMLWETGTWLDEHVKEAPAERPEVDAMPDLESLPGPAAAEETAPAPG
ncbi:MAG TPA: prolyl oligopeptidase family serine peptidase [Thermoanaerobaculia bacterium]|nr:prolyl oligopeptidase family serine peptidase [Thermoanaerobaculia bacterium]